MASPHVAGAIALIKQIDPKLNPLQIKDLIKNNADDLGKGVNQQGSGMINLKKIYNSLTNRNSTDGKPPIPPISLIPTQDPRK